MPGASLGNTHFGSNCDAERAIAVSNRIVTDVLCGMSQGDARLHLIGAEDVQAGGYPCDEHKERKPLQEKDGRTRKGRTKICW